MSTFSDLEPGPTIYWPAGTSARWRLTIRQCKTCPALDLSGDGVEVEFVLKRSATASDATAKFTKKLSTGGIVAVDLALGIVDVIIDADDTVAANGVGSWFYTTRVTLEDGEILQPFGLSGAARLDLTVPTDAPVVAADSTSGTIDPVSLTPAPLPAYATIAYVTTAVAAEATLRAAADTANAAAIATKQNVIDFDGRKVLVVAKGDAATDTRTGLSAYDATRPFATLSAAMAAAVSGDTILIGPGTYTERITLKNGVDIHCDPGVVLAGTYTADNSAESHITDGGAAVACKITGRPNFTAANATPFSNKNAFYITGASTIYVEFGESTLTACGGVANFRIANASASVVLDGWSVSNDSYDGLWHYSGQVSYSVERSTCYGQHLEINVATGETSKNHYRVGLGTNPYSDEPAILIGGSAAGFEAVIEGTFVGNGLLSEVANGDGKFILRNCRIDSSASASHLPINLSFAGIVNVYVENTTLTAHASADYAVGAAGTIHLRDVVTNKPVDPAMTVVGGYYNDAGALGLGGSPGTIGGAGQGGGYSYTPALTVSGGAIISSSSGETLIKNTISGLVHSSATLCRNNVLAIQNTGTTNTARPLPSAIRFLDPDGGERGAIGWSHDTVWAPFARTLFFSASQPYTEGYTPAAPPRMRFLQEGTYLGTERFAGRLEFDTDWTTRFLTPLEAAILTLTPAGAATFANTLLVSGILSAGTTPTTLTDAAGKILSAALNTVAVAQGGTGTTTSTGTGSVVLSASPALTGTPTAPTAAAGTNTTQIATTAAALLAMMDPGFVDLTGYTAWTIASSGAGVANAQSAVNIRLTGPTTAAGYITARTAFSASPIWTKATTAGNGYTFTTQTIVSARIFVESRDANSVWRMSFGKNFSSSNGVLAAKGFGIRQAASGALYLVVHDGTTLTEVASSYTPDTATPFDVRLDSMGNGTVTLYVNGAQVATTALGPVGTGLATPGLWMEVENTNTVTTQPATTFARQKLWFAS
jgi:hypothetical protein